MAHDYLATAPFDLYSLHLFHLVVKHRSFTKAAGIAGLTQSAITRQMQGMERSLGIDLLNRTTRNVEVTNAGMFLYEQSHRLIGDVEATIQQLREAHGQARPLVRLGVSRSIGHGYLPGFLHANLRRQPGTSCRVAQLAAAEIVTRLEANDLDVGILSNPGRISRTLRVMHEFDDAFTLVVPAEAAWEGTALNSRRPRERWSKQQAWIVPGDDSHSGRKLRRWMKANGWGDQAAMEADSFDLILQLVSLGLGVAFVPIRSLAPFPRKHTLRRVTLKQRFERRLLVLTRRHRKLPDHLEQFVANILF